MTGAGERLQAVLSVNEVHVLLAAVEPEYQLMVKLLYGGGEPVKKTIRPLLLTKQFLSYPAHLLRELFIL